MSKSYARSAQRAVDDFQRDLDMLEHIYLSAARTMSEAALRRDLHAIHEHYHPPTLLERAGRRLSQLGYLLVEIGESVSQRGKIGEVELNQARYSVRNRGVSRYGGRYGSRHVGSSPTTQVNEEEANDEQRNNARD